MVRHRDTKGIPTERKTSLLIFLSVGVAVELLCDHIVSTERLSSVFSVNSVRALPFLRALRASWLKIRDFPCNSVVKSVLCFGIDRKKFDHYNDHTRHGG